MTLDSSASLEFPNIGINFTRQPDPVPLTLQPWRRVPITLILLAKCHGSKSSWIGLQLLNWAVREPARFELLLELLRDRDLPDRPVVRFEPAFDRTLDLTVGLGFLEFKKGSVYRLTDVGKGVVKQIEDSGVLAAERERLAMIDGKITQMRLREIMEMRGR